MTKEKEGLQGAPAARLQRGRCEICQHEQATAADWGELRPDDLCWANVGSMSHAKADCYRWGYERLKDESWKHEGCIDEMRKDFDLTLDQCLDRAEAAEKRVAELEQSLRNIAEAQSWRKLVP